MKVAMMSFAVACLLVSGTAFASEELAKSNNCIGCHQVDGKAMGPSLKEIGAKYKADAEGAAKIEKSLKDGSKNVWGATSMMAPQAQVKAEDAKTLATWILSLAADAAPAAPAAPVK